jgi:hypothetical protein
MNLTETRYQIIKKAYSYLVIDTVTGYLIMDTESPAEAQRILKCYEELEALL